MAFPSDRTARLARVTLHTLLLVTLYGLAASLLLGRGTVWLALYGCGAAVLGLLAVGNGRSLRALPVYLFLAVSVTMLVHGILAAGGQPTSHYPEHLLAGAVPVLGILLVPSRLPGGAGLSHRRLIALLASVYVLVQTVALASGWNKFGWFSNSHYLAFYSVLTLPFLLYLLVTSARPSARWIYGLLILMDLALLLKTQSRPGFLALIAGGAVSLPFLAPHARRIAAIALLVVPSALYVSGIYDFRERVDDLVGNLSKDERATLWTEAWRMQMDSSPAQWAIGHGFGSFRRDYARYSSFRRDNERFHFPHNFFTEVLYSHGLTGLAMAVPAYAAFAASLVGAVRRTKNPDSRRLGVLLVSLTAIHFVHAFLTLPLFSRNGYFALALIIGASFRYSRDTTADESR